MEVVVYLALGTVVLTVIVGAVVSVWRWQQSETGSYAEMTLDDRIKRAQHRLRQAQRAVEHIPAGRVGARAQERLVRMRRLRFDSVVRDEDLLEIVEGFEKATDVLCTSIFALGRGMVSRPIDADAGAFLDGEWAAYAAHADWDALVLQEMDEIDRVSSAGTSPDDERAA
ncbi:MAG: hypothetical protein Q7T01_04890 [bacterium]|nr:hypothetical protein [bacterium]